MRIALTAISVFLAPISVTGWGETGHVIIADLASRMMKSNSERFVLSSVPGRTLSESLISASTWADQIADERPETASYHFAHTPYRACAPFNKVRDCPKGDCIVTAIGRFASIAADYHSSPEERAEAIMFLTHLVADIHQPLHLGFKNGTGGTGIFPNTTFDSIRPQLSLHEIWDYDLLHQHMFPVSGKRQSIDAITTLLASRMIDVPNAVAIRRQMMIEDLNIDDVENSFASSIATEITTTLTCDAAYKDITNLWIEPRNFQLNPKYYQLRTVVVLRQLMKASVRLAQLLEAIAARYYETELLLNPPAPTTTTPIPTTRSANRFAVLALEFDVDSHLYEFGQTDDEDMDSVEDDEKADDASVVTSASTATASTSSSLTKHERRELKKQRAKALKKAEKKRARNKAQRDRKKRESKFVDGVDINSLVLIKRDTRLFITAKSRVTSPTFLPSRHIIVFVKFANQGADEEPIGFLLDANVFPEKAYTAGFLLRMFNALKGLEDNEATDFADSAIDGVETFGSEGYDRDFSREEFASLIGMTDADIELDHSQMVTSSKREYSKKFRNAAEQAAAEAAASREAYRHLRRMEDDLIVYKFDKVIFVSTFSLCRRRESSKAFRLNKFDVTETKKSLRQHISLLIDARVVDDKISDQMHEIIRTAIHSNLVKARRESLELVNPGFEAQITDFATSVYGGSARDQMMALSKFRRFEVVPRPDKPYMSTIEVDMTFDIERQGLMSSLLSGPPRNPPVYQSPGPMMFPGLPPVFGMARPDRMPTTPEELFSMMHFGDELSSIFGLPAQAASSSSRAVPTSPTPSVPRKK